MSGAGWRMSGGGGDATPYGPSYAPMVPFSPHIQHYDGDRRGYF